MDTLEAKQILSSYQSEKEPFSDPHMLEAINLLDTDSELSAWFENQLAFDHQVRETVGQLSPPSGLKDSILREYRAARRKVIVHYVRWVGAVTALFLIGVGGFRGYTINYNQKMHGHATLREAMAYFIAGSYFSLDYLDTNLDNIGRWLEEKDLPVYGSIPAALAAREPIGCKEMNWRGQPISLVCFHREDGKVIHLFIARRGDLGEEAIAGLEEVQVSHHLETAGWITDTHVYLLTGSEPGVAVREYLG